MTEFQLRRIEGAFKSVNAVCEELDDLLIDLYDAARPIPEQLRADISALKDARYALGKVCTSASQASAQ